MSSGNKDDLFYSKTDAKVAFFFESTNFFITKNVRFHNF